MKITITLEIDNEDIAGSTVDDANRFRKRVQCALDRAWPYAPMDSVKVTRVVFGLADIVVRCDALDRYRVSVVPQPRVSVAESLLTCWDIPWSGRAMRFAYHALRRALAHGIDVLE